jgi:cob(I)alamin adenosyltransferase
MPIYTRKGDKGETGLFSEERDRSIRVDKDSIRVEAIGALDELNSYLGIVNAVSPHKSLTKFISNIQINIFTINSILAGARLKFSASHTTALEKKIDRLTEELPKLANFVLPAGDPFAAHLMYARALSRRAERRVVSLNKVEEVHPNVLKYLNRLSDMLFTLFRYANHISGEQEVIWRAATNYGKATRK